jgi:ssDNA-binding Zn-finger/Zn-ribbon topoisomerase 1
MTLKSSYGIKDKKMKLKCPQCGHWFEEMIIVIENRKEAKCPECWHVFRVEY